MARERKNDVFVKNDLLKGITEIDYKDTELLKQLMTDNGRMYPGRLTGASAKQQRELKRAIRRARIMSLLP